MTAMEIRDNAVVFDGNVVDVGARILDARAGAGLVLVLVDPDSYLEDPEYRRKRRAGSPAVRNLRAFSPGGTQLWDAEMPEEADYYHRIVSTDPIEVDSFSGFRCRIDPLDGKIASKRFMK